MPKKPHVRTLKAGQHVKGFKTLLQSACQYFSGIFWAIWKKISSKNFVLVVSEILRLFVNILIPDEKYSLSVKASVQPNQFKENFVEIEKHFLNFFLHFRNLNYILNTLKKKWASEVISFWNYRLKKAGLLKCLKSPVS